MPESVWNIGFAVSLIFVLSSCILIARRVFKSGIEYFSSRILILSGITNAILCAMLFLSQGIYEVIRIATFKPIHPSQLLIPVIFITVPIRILWNYFSIHRKPITIYNLQPCANEKINAKIAVLCKRMGITSPAVLFSNLIVSPFVLGRQSNKAFLAVPKQWLNTDSKNQYIQLLHELSHIRNHDMGFLAWSNAVLRDLRLLILLFPILIIYCLILGSSNIVPSILLYPICSLILFAMLRYIVRKRESLADLTAAMLVESSQIKDVIASYESGITEIISEQQIKPDTTETTRRWLLDKAMFSKRQAFWKFLLLIFNFFYLSHPSNFERLKKISSYGEINAPKFLVADSFLAGMAIGLLGTVVGLGGFWFSTSFQHHQEKIDFLKFPFMVLGIAAPIAIGYLAIFLVIPVWSSIKLPAIDNRFITKLLGRYVIALAGASVICPIILTAGATNTQVLILMTICLLWNVFIVGFGFFVNIVILSLWTTMRYLQSSHIVELRKGILSLWSFIIAIFGLILFGIILINNKMTFSGANVIFSTIAGGAIVARAVRGSRFSETERYIILCLHKLVYRFEGKCFRLFIWTIYSFYCTFLLFIFVPIIYLVMNATGNLFKNLDSIVAVLTVSAASCIVMVLLGRNGFKRISEHKKSKINIFYHCLKPLSVPIDATIRKEINEVVKNYDLKTSNEICGLNLTMRDVYEIITFIHDDNSQKKVIDHLAAWVFKCQSQGFGIWPASTSRLYSTYQAISILYDINMINKCDAKRHSLWIKSLQLPDGSFRCPFGKRDSWQDTFYAIKSLDMLSESLDAKETSSCRNWCRNILIEEGLNKNRPDIIYHCFGILKTLGKIDDDIFKLVLERMSCDIEKLLLTNVSLDYENIYFAVMTYDLLDKNPVISLKSLTLLSERIKTALKAEFSNICL